MSSEYQSLPPATRQAAMSAAEALAPEQSVDEVRESLSVTEKGQPANTIGNCRTVFCHDPLLRGAIRLNLLTDRVDIVRDLGWRRNTSALTLFQEALGHAFEEPKRWQLHNINEIMNTVVTGWKPFSNPRMFAGYGRQRGWEREISGNELPDNEGGFVELSEEEVRQLELPKEWIA